jgi:hypothetical protein
MSMFWYMDMCLPEFCSHRLNIQLQVGQPDHSRICIHILISAGVLLRPLQLYLCCNTLIPVCWNTSLIDWVFSSRLASLIKSIFGHIYKCPLEFCSHQLGIRLWVGQSDYPHIHMFPADWIFSSSKYCISRPLRSCLCFDILICVCQNPALTNLILPLGQPFVNGMNSSPNGTCGCPNGTYGCPNGTYGCLNSTRGCPNGTYGCSNGT